MTVTSLDDALKGLKAKVPNDLALAPVCVRLMLRTGVNLRAPRADQLADKGLLSKVIASLSEMGYPL
jgi:hypothetical protein